MKFSQVLLVLVMLPSLLCEADRASAQADSLDGPSFAEISLKAISGSSPSDRRGARNVVAGQLAQLPSGMRNVAIGTFASKLRSDDTKPNQDVLAILANVPLTWSTANTKGDMDYLYDLLSKSTDDTTRSLADAALANAKGSYKDGIASYNSTHLPELAAAVQPLTFVAQTYPKSRYAERASFYLGHLYSKQYLLQDQRDLDLLNKSNAQLEDYIKRAEQGEFGRTDYLAAGYFYRGLNAWISGKPDEALSWLNKGKNKFANTDQIYVYQLFVSTNKATVIDRYLPAQNAFGTTISFLSRLPRPTPDQSVELISTLKLLN